MRSAIESLAVISKIDLRKPKDCGEFKESLAVLDILRNKKMTTNWGLNAHDRQLLCMALMQPTATLPGQSIRIFHEIDATGVSTHYQTSTMPVLVQQPGRCGLLT